MQIETVTTDSFAMDYFRFGHGDKALVILPGLSVQSVMMSANAVVAAYRPLTDAFTMYVFDRRKDLPATYSLYDMARNTAWAIRALDLRRTSVFGASMGGMIAMAIAIEQPDLVEKLVLCSTSPVVDACQYQVVENWIKLAKAKDTTGLYLAFGEAIYPQDMFAKIQKPLVAIAESVTADELERFIIQAEGMRGFNVVDDLDKIACPVFVVGSKDDQIMGAEGALQIAEHVGNQADLQLHLYEGYGHAAYDTAPDFKERMLRFLE